MGVFIYFLYIVFCLGFLVVGTTTHFTGYCYYYDCACDKVYFDLCLYMNKLCGITL